MRCGRLRIFFDGGCRPNPGPIEIAAVARGIVYREGAAGFGDSSEAEWRALIHAAAIARALGASDVEFVGDSACVINQARGLWKCRDERLRVQRDLYRAAIAGFAAVRLRHVARSRNLAGIALAQGHGR